ncbi:hypothetical protein [Pseudonocardia sp. MH-G8]|uniref:hypothetical protein n=1 Tax=Pseudonocardia sp. MH-G8 TaxID=1854588 RepID=UPI000BA18A71|nr:hypothetical protein [Pseudonocardia sp. MH-G8]OZM75838.1 hypothetical protein CFP66_44110 [Pseudonocardia sp. MH-G8]
MSTKFRLVTEVLAEVARTGRPEIARTDEVRETFGSVEAFLLALHHRWRTALVAHLDTLLEDPPADLDAAVHALWADPGLGGRGLRPLLDAHAGHPALAAAQERERVLVRRDLGVEISPAVGLLAAG